MDIKQMKIEVLLTDQVNESIDNYDENRILFEANKFEAKKIKCFICQATTQQMIQRFS